LFEEQQSNEVAGKVHWTMRQTLNGLFFTLVPWIVFAFTLSYFNTSPPRTAPQPPTVDLLNALLAFVLLICVESAFLIAPFFYASRAYRTLAMRGRLALQALGFRNFKVRSALSWVVGLFVAILVLNVLYQYIISYFHLNLQTNDQVILQQSRTAPLTTYATLLISVLVAPLCEEIFFRGFVFAGFLRALSVGWATLLSALIFAVAHADPGSFVVLFFIGVALAFLRWHTASLWPSIILHTLNNGIGALLIVLVMMGIIQP
jgi:membrane protease YdiL (CAAX protease family)